MRASRADRTRGTLGADYRLTGWRVDSEVRPLEWRNVDLAGGEVRLALWSLYSSVFGGVWTSWTQGGLKLRGLLTHRHLPINIVRRLAPNQALLCPDDT